MWANPRAPPPPKANPILRAFLIEAPVPTALGLSSAKLYQKPVAKGYYDKKG